MESAYAHAHKVFLLALNEFEITLDTVIPRCKDTRGRDDVENKSGIETRVDIRTSLLRAFPAAKGGVLFIMRNRWDKYVTSSVHGTVVNAARHSAFWWVGRGSPNLQHVKYWAKLHAILFFRRVGEISVPKIIYNP